MTAAELRLSTPRLELTALAITDLEAVWPHVADPAISEHMSWDPHQSKQETIEFLERVENDLATGRSLTWGIWSMKEFCGVFSVINILRSHRVLRYDRGELAYWCAPKHQGKGLMSEAGHCIIEFAFGRLALNRLVVGHHVENSGSRKLIERLGFTLIGTEHEAFMKHGRWIDIKTYELLSRDHKSAH